MQYRYPSSPLFPSYAAVCVLWRCNDVRQGGHSFLETLGILETIKAFLPSTIAFHTNLDASKNHLLPPSKVDSQLYHVSIVHRPWSWFDARLTKSNVVQKRARRAFYVFNVPLAIGAPELTMPSANHFGFEANWSGWWRVCWWIWVAVSLWISSNTDNAVFVR